jgi:TPR repeat protein
MKYIASVFVSLAFCISTVWADDFEDGSEAYKKKDYATALKKFRSAAVENDAYAQVNLGIMYDRGLGVLQDYGEAMRWYKLAAAQGIAEAQVNLGVMYFLGQGVAQDYFAAARWYKLAAAQGNSNAQYKMGVMHINGDGVLQDYVKAHMWFNISAVQGYANASSIRDTVAAKMTTQQVADAQNLARECQTRNFKNCD